MYYSKPPVTSLLESLRRNDTEKMRAFLHGLKRQCFAASYNVGNVLTYVVSGVDFPKHIKWPIEPLGSILLYLAISFGGAVLALSNQRTMPDRLQMILNDPECVCCRIPSCTWFTVYSIGEINFSSAFKSIVSSASLWALLNSIPIIGFWPGFIISLTLLLGNFVAQLANFLEPYLKSKRVDKATCSSLRLLKYGVSGFLAFSYSANQCALYFNTFDLAMMNIGVKVFAGRLSQLNNAPKLIVFIANVVFSCLYGLVTLYHYFFRINKLFCLANEATVVSPESIPYYKKISVAAWVASGWKTAAGVISIVTILSRALGKPYVYVGAVISVILSIGSLITTTSSYARNKTSSDSSSCWARFCSPRFRPTPAAEIPLLPLTEAQSYSVSF